MTVGEIREMIKGCDDSEQLILLLQNGYNGHLEWSRIENMTADKYVSIKDCIKVFSKFCDRQEEACFSCPLFKNNCCQVPIINGNWGDDVLNFNYNTQEKR